MSDSERGQVSAAAAEVYEEFFLPALFEQWPDHVAAAAGIEPGQRVLDVACGTGVLARHVARRLGNAGAVTGLDLNQGMLAVAKSRAPGIQWRQGPAEALPYDAGSFDAVVSQFGLMFFVDPAAALREMLRVLRPGGRLAVAVWDRLESSPGYAAMADLLQRLFGDEIADALRVPFRLGDPAALHSLCAEASVPQPGLTTHAGSVRFPSIRSWMYTDIKGWTLGDRLDDAQYERLLREAETELQPYVGADGRVAFGTSAHIVAAAKPE